MFRRASIPAVALCTACLLAFAARLVFAQAGGPSTQPLDFGAAGLDIAPAVEIIVVSPRTVDLLGEALLRETGARRLRLMRDLGECRSPLAAPHVRKMLSDPMPAMRAQAARSVARVGEQAILAALQPLLKDPAAAVRREAVLACAALGSKAAVAGALSDADMTVVAAALRLATTAEHADLIAGRLRTLPSATRTAAIRALGDIGAGSAHAAAVAPFLTSDTGGRIAAIGALAALESTGHADAVIAMVRDDHPGVRRAATAALASLAFPDVQRTRAVEMLRDADPGVREAAAVLLTAHPSVQAIPLLLEQLDDGDEPLRLAARAALIATNDAAVVSAAKLLTDTHPRRREDGSYILGHLRSDAALATHVAMLEDADWLVVAQAAWSLGQIGRPEALELLAGLVKQIPQTAALLPQEQQHAFSEAVLAVARLAYQPAAADLARLLVELAPTAQRGPAPRLRAACAWGFGILGSANDTATCDALLGVVDEILEQSEAKVEAVKALGHLRYVPATAHLKRIGETSLDPRVRWMGCWSYERITGLPLAYLAPRQMVSPDDVSIVALP